MNKFYAVVNMNRQPFTFLMSHSNKATAEAEAARLAAKQPGDMFVVLEAKSMTQVNNVVKTELR